MERLTIGTVSRRSGISIRMLRHYDEIGLVHPARRPGSGYRLYAPEDLERLQAIVALRQLGFGLKEIGSLLANGEMLPAGALTLRLRRLEEEIARRTRLRDTLQALLRRLDRAETPSLDELLDVLREMTTMERINAYYTEEQLAELAERGEALGEAGMRQAEADWEMLFEDVRGLIAAGVPPTDPRVQAAAARWTSLVEAFTGGNPGIAANLQRIWENETEIQGINAHEVRELGAYIEQARKAAS